MKAKLNAYQKKEHERKRIQKVVTLKKYAKLCKAEGIQSNRVNLGKVSTETKMNNPEASNLRKLAKKENSASKTKEPSSNKQQQKQAVHDQLTDRIKGIEEAMNKRKQLKKCMTSKTSKGQPVMKGRIQNILSKLMKQQ